MDHRPMSERRHELDDAEHVFDVRVWNETGVDEGHWRTLAVTATHDDAATVASAVVSAAAAGHRYAEVWGPGRDSASQRRCVDRFPVPSQEERREMWLEAAEETFSEAYIDTRH